MSDRSPIPGEMVCSDNRDEPMLVLVVDDSRLQRKILSSSLKRWGYRVMEAASGEAAMEICAIHSPELVLSDWMMPGMSGIEFCKAFRETSGEGYSYFILLTSKSEKNEVAEGLDAGADDFLTKPVDAHELRARITAGERILAMQRELTLKNLMITDTLDELQRLYDSLDGDLIEAKKLQQSLVPERFRSFDEGDLSLHLRSSGHVGGDLVGFYPAAAGHLGLFAIDVSGHGVSSALMTARLAGYLSATALDQNVALQKLPDGSFCSRPPSEAIKTLNELVLGEMETEHYFTLMLVNIDLNTGKVLIGQAGQPHPVIQRKSGAIEQDGSGGFPVGLISGVDFSQFELQLHPGDRLAILSDGVTECPLADGTLLGEEGLEWILMKLQTTAGAAFFDALMVSLTEVSGLREFPDDVSGLLFEYRGPVQPK
ncbi:MAG: fused response regulator/phosphatase [Paracoccaceae bacterium]|nr:fused response regulator/phosphatase [Paracoccaceae bacterium]